MYRVIEVANNLGVSKVTVYKKLSAFKNEMKPHIHKQKNVTYIDEGGVEIIRQSLVANQVIHDTSDMDSHIENLESVVEENNTYIKFLNESLIESEKSHMEDLHMIISVLRAQVKLKDSEIETRNKLIKDYKNLLAYSKKQVRRIEEKMILLE